MEGMHRFLSMMGRRAFRLRPARILCARHFGVKPALSQAALENLRGVERFRRAVPVPAA
jgi:hypothetical protein